MAAKFHEFSPKRRLTFHKFSGADGETKCLKYILEHYFNFSVGILVPSMSKQKICQTVSCSSVFTEFCCLADLALTDFINPQFIQKFVRQGSVMALSYGTRIDTSDCVALLPTGILMLSLTKDTYECLGLQGKPSPFNKKNSFDVEVNLLASYFRPQKKYYERVKSAFQRMKLKFKFLLSTIPSQGTDGQSTPDLGAYLKSSGIGFQPFSCESNTKELINIDVPLVSFNESLTEETSDSECHGLAFHEWLGSMVCGIDCSTATPDSYTNTLCCPKPHQKRNAAFCKWTGFLPSNQVQGVVKRAREILKGDPTIPWLSVLVWGFSDSPVSWGNHHHGYYVSGDNHFTLVLFPNDQIWMYTTLGDHDEQP